MNDPITPQQRLTIVKHLANGKDIRLTATITHLTSEQVTDVAKSHGYPDREKLSWAADTLASKIERDAADAIPAGTPPRIPVPRAPSQAPTVTPIHRDEPRAPDEIRVLLNIAKAAKPQRIQRLADKVFADLDRLRTMLDAETEKQRARDLAAREKSAAVAKVKRLEAELAAAKAALRGDTKPAEPSTTDPKAIRAWASAHGVECPAFGRVPQYVRTAYEEAQAS